MGCSCSRHRKCTPHKVNSYFKHPIIMSAISLTFYSVTHQDSRRTFEPAKVLTIETRSRNKIQKYHLLSFFKLTVIILAFSKGSKTDDPPLLCSGPDFVLVVPVVSVISFWLFRWFRWFRSRGFVSVFRVLVHARQKKYVST